MAKGQKSQIVTKKHLARQERERLQNRYIMIGSISVIVIVVALLLYGVVQQYLIQPQQPVAKVGTEVVTTKQFQTFARYQRLQLIQTYTRAYNQYQQFAALFGSDTSSQSYAQQYQAQFDQYLAQINYQLEPATLGQSTLDYLVANIIIQREADTRGITVSKEEIDKAVHDYFGYYPNGTPTTAPTSPVIPTSTLSPTQLALLPPTPTASPTPTAQVTPTITATQEIASPTPTTVITPTEPAPTSTPGPTPTEYTLDAYNKDFQSYMTEIGNFASISEADLRWIFGMQLLRQKVMDAITADVSQEQDQVWARHIQVTDQTQAQSIYTRLQAGEDFLTIATEVYSGTGVTNNGDLGWFGVGTLESAAEKVVFNLQIGQFSEPIQTTSGWEIYQVLGHEVRTLTDSQFQQLKQTTFQNWVDEQRQADNVQIFDIWQTRVPTKPTIPPTQPAQ
jgi:PPIC-type PPIASE domain/SurA-like N-terminal domain